MLQEVTAENLEEVRSESGCGLLSSLDLVVVMSQSHGTHRGVLSKKAL